jgi:hypothetical protein
MMTSNGQVSTVRRDAPLAEREFWLLVRRQLAGIEKAVQVRYNMGRTATAPFGWIITWDVLQAAIETIERHYKVGRHEPTARSFDP